MKRRGPRTEPWRTPWERREVGDLQLLMEMKCRLSERYDVKQLRAVPVMLKMVSSQVRRME